MTTTQYRLPLSVSSPADQADVQGFATPIPIPLPNPDAPAPLPDQALLGIKFLGLLGLQPPALRPGPRPKVVIR